MTATTEATEINLGAPGLDSETRVPAPVQLCTHIMATGATCGSPAVKGTRLCFHHSAVKSALGRVTPIDQVPYGIFSPIPFVFAEDAASLEINYQLLLQAVAEKRVDNRTGTLLFRILRSMAENLKNPLIAESPATHGEGDQINPQPESTTHAQNTAPEIHKSEINPAGNSEGNSEEGDDHPQPATPRQPPSPARRARPADDPTLQAAIEALPETSRDSIHKMLATRDYLEDLELQYFSLPPYDKTKPEPWLPDPLSPSVQRILAMSCERP